MNRKKRILWTTEFTRLNTGYSLYYHEVMTRLQQTSKYELFELASYARGGDPLHQQLMKDIPWKVYPNMPLPHEQGEYDSDPINEFGKWKLEQVCLDCQPDIICSIKDPWMDMYIEQSPYRRLFKTVFMPTVDGKPLQEEWLDHYMKTDYILNYTEFGENLLGEEGGGLINLKGLAPASVDTNVFKFVPNKREHKEKMGMHGNSLIIGMVARNQKRKLYPALAESFSEFLHNLNLENTENVFLYFHTAYPDLGFNMPYLVKQNGLSHKVLFTMFCRNCSFSFPSFYQDVRVICPRCHNGSASFSNSQTGVTREELAATYALMDLYVQYVSNEGQGIPAVEAAVCGIPICATDYSGCSSIVRNVRGFPIPVKTLFCEVETNRQMALPDNQAIIKYITEFVSLPESVRSRMGLNMHINAVQHYGDWSKTAAQWERIFDEIPIQEGVWRSPIDYVNVDSVQAPDHTRMSDEQFVNWLLAEVVRRPDWIGSYIGLKMMRDLTYGSISRSQLGFCSNDASMLGSRPIWDIVDRPKMLEYCKQMRNRTNHFELLRNQFIQEGKIK